MVCGPTIGAGGGAGGGGGGGGGVGAQAAIASITAGKIAAAIVRLLIMVDVPCPLFPRFILPVSTG